MLGEIDGDAAELDGVAAGPEPDVDDVAQPHLAPVGGERAVLELVVHAPRDGLAARRHDAVPVVGMDARHEEVGLSEPVLGVVAEDDLGALAHEREGERAGVGLPHDGVEPLDEVAEALLGGQARGLQALLLAEVLHDQEEAGGVLLRHVDGGQGDQDRPALLALPQVQIEEDVALGDARGQHLVGTGDQAVGAHDQGQVAAEDIVLVQVKRVEEGGVDGEHAQVGGEEQEAGGHARDDRLRIPPEVEDRALLLHLRAQERGALPLAPEADQQAGERQEEEGRRQAGELRRAVELGEGLLAVDLEHEAPGRRRDPADGGKARHPAIVGELPEAVVGDGGRLDMGGNRLERAADGVALPRRVAQWRQVGGAALVHAKEQRLARSGRDAFIGEEREEPGLGRHGERDDAQEAARVLREDGHRDAEDSPVGRLVDQVDVLLAIPGDGGGFDDRCPGLGGAARPSDEPPLGIEDPDARVAIGGRHLVQVLDERGLAAALALEPRAHDRRGGEDLGVAPPGREPALDGAHPVVGDRRHAAPPLGQGAAALVLDVVPDRDHDEGSADQEGEEVDPRHALAGAGARGPGGIQRVREIAPARHVSHAGRTGRRPHGRSTPGKDTASIAGSFDRLIRPPSVGPASWVPLRYMTGRRCQRAPERGCAPSAPWGAGVADPGMRHVL